MKNRFTIIRILILIFLLISFKLIFNSLPIKNLFLFRILEFLSFFILSYSFTFLTDFSNEYFQDKLILALKIAIGYSIIAFIISIFKQNVVSNLLLLAILNYVIFILLSLLPFIRDKFFLNDNSEESFFTNVGYIGLFFIYKLVSNIIFLFLANDSFKYINRLNIILLTIFGILVFFIRPFVISYFVKGFLEYNSKQYPVCNSIRVGRSANADVKVDDIDAPKATFFSIYAGKKWKVSPSFSLKVNNKTVTTKTNIQDGDTIETDNDFFSVNIGKGNLLKRLFLLFTFLLLFLNSCKERDYIFSTVNKNQDIILENTDSSQYNKINAFIFASHKFLSDKKKKIKNKHNFFILEKDKTAKIKKIETDNLPLDLVFVLDKTGSMNEEFKRLDASFEKFLLNIQTKRKSLRIGIISFADKKEQINIFNLNTDIKKCSQYIKNIKSVPGGDYEENPYDALMMLRKLSFRKDAQKLVILFTDAPPHRKSLDISRKKPTTELDTSDVIKYINSSSILLYIVSYSPDNMENPNRNKVRDGFNEYQKLITNKPYKFFDIDQYDDFNDIVSDLEYSINNQFKITYNSKKAKSFYEKGGEIKIFSFENARTAHSEFEKEKIRRTSFYRSLFDVF